MIRGSNWVDFFRRNAVSVEKKGVEAVRRVSVFRSVTVSVTISLRVLNSIFRRKRANFLTLIFKNLLT